MGGNRSHPQRQSPGTASQQTMPSWALQKPPCPSCSLIKARNQLLLKLCLFAEKPGLVALCLGPIRDICLLDEINRPEQNSTGHHCAKHYGYFFVDLIVLLIAKIHDKRGTYNCVQKEAKNPKLENICHELPAFMPEACGP